MTKIDRLLADHLKLREQFTKRAADPSVSGDMLHAEMQAAGLPATRSSVFTWRRRYRVAKRHRPNSLAGRVASALQAASAEQLKVLRLPARDITGAVFSLSRNRLYAVAKAIGLYPHPDSRKSCA